MDKSTKTRSTALNVVTNQPNRKNSKSIDPLAKIRPMISKKPQLVPIFSRSNTIQISPGLKMLNTRIQSLDDPTSYQPLVTISDNENSEKEDDEEENFVSPIQKLTKEELREELKIFNQTSHEALLANDNDDDTGDIQFRIEQPIKRSVCCYQYPFSFKDSSCIIS